jgi:orotate phosphoribosyltransferase
MQDEILGMLKKAHGLITNDHFVYTSGKHGSVYINKDALYPHTHFASRVGELFAQKYKDENIDVVCGPSLGGIILSQWTAYHLSKIKEMDVLGVYTEKDAQGNQVFSRRGYDKLVKGKNILIVEDLTTTGGSVKKVVDTVKKAEGNVVAVCVMVNRNPKEVTSSFIGAPFSSLAVLQAEAYDENICPLCKKGKPINIKIGHGKKFMEKRKIA